MSHQDQPTAAARIARFYAVGFLLILFLPIPASYANYHLGNLRNWHILLTVLTLGLIAWRRISWSELLAVRLSPLLERALFWGIGAAFVASTALHYYGLRINGEDFSIFDWMLYNTRHREFMTTPICNIAPPLGVCHHFGIHPSYIMLPLVPLHALFESPLFLTVTHAVAAWLGLIPLSRILRRYVPRGLGYYLVLMAYATNSYMGSILNHGFHFEVFFLPLGLWFIDAWLGGKRFGWILPAVLFASVKEDGAVYLGLFSAAVLLWERPRAREAGILLAVSMVVFLVNTKVVQPYFLALSGRDMPLYMGFWGQYGHGWGEVALFILQNPGRVLKDIATSDWYQFFGAMLLLPFLSRRPLLVILFVAVMFGMSDNPHLRHYGTYYSSPLLPFAFWGLLEGYERLQSWSMRLATPVLVTACVLFSLLGGGYMKYPVVRTQALTDLAEIRDELSGHLGVVCAQKGLFPYLPYEWHLQPLSRECLAARGAIGLMSEREEIDPWPFTGSELAAWREELQTVRLYPSGIAVVRQGAGGEKDERADLR